MPADDLERYGIFCAFFSICESGQFVHDDC